MTHVHVHEEHGGPRIESGYSGVVTPPPPAADHGEGPVMTDAAYQKYLDKLAAHPLLRDDNVRLAEGAGKGIGAVLMGVGLIGLALTVLLAFVFNTTHALAAYEVGVFTVLACCLGALFLVMLLNMLNAYWTATIRRQLENIASLVWVPWLLLLPVAVIEVVSGGVLLRWMGDEYAGNVLLEHKAAFLNWFGFLVRYAIYGVIWIVLANGVLGVIPGVCSLSREQDITGDRWLTRRARRMSGFGLLLFALSVPLASFDFLMSMDFRFFSTMWGVYIFAGAVMSAIALTAIVLSVLRTFGRLTGVVTAEHYHDLGKLMFAFTVFWAYVAFSQYFLIWYGNIPEETNYFLHRTTGDWQPLATIIVIGHFIVPFFLLITRKTKRNTLGLGLMGAFLLVMQILDLVFIIRPMVYVEPGVEGPGYVGWALDAVGVIGVLALFGGALIAKIASGPLIPLRDPRLAKALKHKNYV